ncbi:MAG: hypothetical protein JO277_07795 [Candidatus Eremiobacteraeota bacterium]|nr:hypothetical protein [Candidatus Eremiobacteraeota bacterium]
MRSSWLTVVPIALFCGCAGTPPGNPAALPAQSNASVGSDHLGVTPLNAPASVFPGIVSTEPTGIRAKLIAAVITLRDGKTVGGLYDRATQTWRHVGYPSAASTAAYGPESIPGGYRVAGSFTYPRQKNAIGFVYDSVTKRYVTLEVPSPLVCAPVACTTYTIAHSVYGGRGHFRVVGDYAYAIESPPSQWRPFLYDSVTKTLATIDIPKSVSTTAHGLWVDGNVVTVAGGYTDSSGVHGYVRDLGSGKLLTYDYPGATTTRFEGITGSDGRGNYALAGDYTLPHDAAVYGFYVQIFNWKAWPPIVIGRLSANSIDGHDVVGVYHPGGKVSGFITTIPIQDPP